MQDNGLKGIERVVVLAVALVAGLLAAPSFMAQTLPPPSGSCQAGSYLIEAFGPTLLPCGAADCTQIEYKISGGIPDHVATVVASGSTDCLTGSIFSVKGGKPTGNQSYAPGVGDPVTGLGKYACHEEAAKINPVDAVTYFKVAVTGKRDAAPKSVVVKKGGTTKSCEIVGIGEAPAGPNPLATFVSELYEELGGKCKVHVHTDKQTGVTTVDLVSPSPPCYLSDPIPIGDVTVKVGEDSMGPVLFSEGFSFMVGTGTCTYKQYYPTTGNVYKICW